MFYVSTQLRISSSQLTNSNLFQVGRLNHEPAINMALYPINIQLDSENSMVFASRYAFSNRSYPYPPKNPKGSSSLGASTSPAFRASAVWGPGFGHFAAGGDVGNLRALRGLSLDITMNKFERYPFSGKIHNLCIFMYIYVRCNIRHLVFEPLNGFFDREKPINRIICLKSGYPLLDTARCQGTMENQKCDTALLWQTNTNDVWVSLNIECLYTCNKYV